MDDELDIYGDLYDDLPLDGTGTKDNTAIATGHDAVAQQPSQHAVQPPPQAQPPSETVEPQIQPQNTSVASTAVPAAQQHSQPIQASPRAVPNEPAHTAGVEIPREKVVTAKHGKMNWNAPCSAYVGAMNWWTTIDDLLDACYAEGVKDIIMVNFYENKRNGQSMGYAVVVCQTEASSRLLVDKLCQRPVDPADPNSRNFITQHATMDTFTSFGLRSNKITGYSDLNSTFKQHRPPVRPQRGGHMPPGGPGNMGFRPPMANAMMGMPPHMPMMGMMMPGGWVDPSMGYGPQPGMPVAYQPGADKQDRTSSSTSHQRQEREPSSHRSRSRERDSDSHHSRSRESRRDESRSKTRDDRDRRGEPSASSSSSRRDDYDDYDRHYDRSRSSRRDRDDSYRSRRR